MPSLQLAGGEPDPWCPSLRHRRCDQRETRDLDIEARSVFGGHMIAALHRPGRRRERAARDVIAAAAAFDHGLFADYAFAPHHLARPAAVGVEPVPGSPPPPPPAPLPDPPAIQ